MFPFVNSNAEQRQAGPFSGPGADLLFLDGNRAAGHVAVLRKFRAVAVASARIRPEARESVAALSRQWQEDGAVYGPGTHFHIPKGERCKLHAACSQALSLTVFDEGRSRLKLNDSFCGYLN